MRRRPASTRRRSRRTIRCATSRCSAQRVTAERLETEVVRPGIRRWNEARVRKAVGADGVWRNVRHFLRQVVTDTTVNLATSETASRAPDATTTLLRPPLSFFLNRDIAVRHARPRARRCPTPRPSRSRAGSIASACARYDVHRSDGAIRVDGDAHFAFLTPEPAFEDTHLVDAMLQAGLLTDAFRRLPVDDRLLQSGVLRRAARACFAMCPTSCVGANAGERLRDAVRRRRCDAAVAADATAPATADSPEREFLANWRHADLRRPPSARRIADYFHALAARHERRRRGRRLVPARRVPSPALSRPAARGVRADDAAHQHSRRRAAAAHERAGRVETSSDLTHCHDPQRRHSVTRFDPPGFLDDLTDAAEGPVERRRSRAGSTGRAPATRQGTTARAVSSSMPLTTSAGGRRAGRGDLVECVSAPGQGELAERYAALAPRGRRPQRAGRVLRMERHARSGDAARSPASTFTCEGPEYWEALAAAESRQGRRALSGVRLAGGDAGGSVRRTAATIRYNRFNNSTSNGAMHLIQGANTLTAEIELGAAATIRRAQAGAEITDAQELIRCSRYGEPERNSDPFIGEQVNALARQQADITLNNPVGLYLHEFNPVGWTTPDGEDARRFWSFVRGRDDHFVRAVFEVPPGRGYVVGDITIDGRPIEFGAQIADFITIKLEGLATRIGAEHGRAVPRHAGATPVRGGAAGGCSAACQSCRAEWRRRSCTAGRRAARWRAAAVELPRSGADRAAAGGAAPGARGRRRRGAAAAPPALLPYPKLAGVDCSSRARSPGKIMAYASPDSTFAVTKRLLDSAQQSIVIGIYDFNADYMKERSKQRHAARRHGVADARHELRRRSGPVRGARRRSAPTASRRRPARPAIRSPISATRTRRSSSSTARS